MGSRELAHVAAAMLLLFIVSGLGFALQGETESLTLVFIFAVIIIAVHVVIKKMGASLFDANVEHRIWHVYRYGIKPHWHFKREVPFGLIFPILFSAITLGIFKVMTLLTYETRALKHRAAKRFGFYSYTSMTDWHNGLIGAFSIVAVLLVSLVGYLAGFEFLTKMAAYYAFWNMFPVSNLDGTQIFFGSRVLWFTLGFISLLFALFALLL